MRTGAFLAGNDCIWTRLACRWCCNTVRQSYFPVISPINPVSVAGRDNPAICGRYDPRTLARARTEKFEKRFNRTNRTERTDCVLCVLCVFCVWRWENDDDLCVFAARTNIYTHNHAYTSSRGVAVNSRQSIPYVYNTQRFTHTHYQSTVTARWTTAQPSTRVCFPNIRIHVSYQNTRAHTHTHRHMLDVISREREECSAARESVLSAFLSASTPSLFICFARGRDKHIISRRELCFQLFVTDRRPNKHHRLIHKTKFNKPPQRARTLANSTH